MGGRPASIGDIIMKLEGPYKILKLEFPGVKDAISNYSSDGLIGNPLSKVEIALSKDSPGEVPYFLEKIHGWYGKNLNEILGNDFVFNKDGHIEAKDKIDALYDQMKSYDFPT